MNIENCDFWSIFQKEGEPFYNNLYKIPQKLFNNFIYSNIKSYGIINSFIDVKPPVQIIDQIKINDFRLFKNQCHYAAKKLSLMIENCDYVNGFILRKDWYHPIITHSFNIFHSKIIDISRLEEDFSLINEEYSYLPHEYFGIPFPYEFVKRNSNQPDIMNPLIYEWYMENV